LARHNDHTLFEGMRGFFLRRPQALGRRRSLRRRRSSARCRCSRPSRRICPAHARASRTRTIA
jgi:hypothetical protein